VQLVSPEGEILYSSDSVETVLGYRPDEIVGHNATTYIHPDDISVALAWITEVSAQPNGVGSLQYRVRHKNGSWAWVETTIANHLATPTINALVGNFRNITERKQAEAEHEMFAAAAAHDLKTPLTSLRGQVQLLLRRARRGTLTDVGAITSRLDVIDAVSGRMVTLIDEMLDAAHIRAGRTLDLELAPADLVALAEAITEEARLSTIRHAVRVETEVESLVGAWDEARLTRALGNLLSNAVKFSPDGGEISVRVWREEEAAGMWAVLSVTDQGMGIPVADLPHLFERFRRGGNVAGRIAGTGIGLAGAKQIVEQHGGTITVESEEGNGATFTVRLPLEQGIADGRNSSER
jgi:PAS domain S-box-containing protein